MDYLRCDRAMFVNEECIIQLHEGRMSPKNESWICDAVAINLRDEKVFLCEVTYAVGMSNLIKRLRHWNDNWERVRAALAHYSSVDPNWEVRPWLFIPDKFVKPLVGKMAQVLGPAESWSFNPRITTLESVQPWQLKSDHCDSMTDKSNTDIPESMRS